MANILTRLDKDTEGGIMAKISEQDQTLADSIRALMFVFDDLIKLDDRGMQELMKEISKEDLPGGVARRKSGDQGQVSQEHVQPRGGDVERGHGRPRTGQGNGR